MAYIAPNSTIEFFGDLGIDSSYENTFYFASVADKDAYFTSLVKVGQPLTAQSYTRAGRGVIKVQRTMAEMYQVGYMRFKNTSFENKWFYAFVTGVDYINNVTTQVRFTIDVMMTWMGVFQLTNCFIERQHSETDNIGDNIVDEGLPCGDLLTEFCYPSGYMGSVTGNWKICLATTADPDDGSSEHGAIYGGIYSGAGYYYYDDNDAITLNAKLAYLSSTKPSAIIGLAIVPAYFLSQAGSNAQERDYHVVTKPYATVNGYTPVNKKLFIYPYKSLQVSNCEGTIAEYRYEFFNTQASPTYCDFEMWGVTGLQSEVCCSPVNYKGVEHNINEKISMVDFPMCSYNIDAFNAYIAQNKGSMIGETIGSIAQTAFNGLAIGSGAGAGATVLGSMAVDLGAPLEDVADSFTGNVAPALGQIASTIGKLSDYYRMPPQNKGAQGANATIGRAYGKQNKDFYFIGKTITAQYAKIIDDYFTMFGYAMNTVATPNMCARPKYTYVKTIGCIVEGGMPSDDAKRIEAIFDKGVRFWRSVNGAIINIGNYTGNAPTA